MQLNDIHPKAVLGNNVKVGNFSTICEDVVIGDNTVIEPNVVIYPNPTQGEFNIVLSGMQGEAVIVIYDYLGQFIGRFSVDTDIEGIVVPYSLAGKAAGIYMVTVFNHYQMITKKVIKETASSYGIYDWDW